jgi:hypothetical protein
LPPEGVDAAKLGIGSRKRGLQWIVLSAIAGHGDTRRIPALP